MTLPEKTLAAATVSPRALARRFEPIERFAHWWVAGCFAMTLLSGASLGEDGGGAMSVRLTWHIVSASALVAGMVLLPLLPGRRALWGSVRALIGLNPVDRSSGRSPGSLVPDFSAGAPQRRRKFNAGHTLMAYALAALMVGIYVTGIAAVRIGGGEREGGPHGAVVAITVVVLAGHVFLAVIYPSTRPAPRGMLTGWVDRRWAQRHHPGWLAELDARRAE